MNRPKVITVVGTRPEIIKLSRVIPELDKHFEQVLVRTGQNFDYELNDIFFRELDIRPSDYSLEVAGGTYAETIGNVIIKADEVFVREQPDALLILGDTNSCLCTIPAKRRKILVFHMEAGNRCFDDRVPEEINRRIVDHTSDVNMPYTEHARRHLLAEGIRPDRIVKTGSPMPEVLAHYWDRIDASDALKRLELTAGEYFVASFHREENIDAPEDLTRIIASLNALAATHARPVVVTMHPHTREQLNGLGGSVQVDPQVRLVKPLGLFDYVHLQKHAMCVVSDSGSIAEEASALDFAAVTVRRAFERPEAVEAGAVLMCGLSCDHLLKAVEIAIQQHAGDGRAFRQVPDYECENVSKKVAQIILSYLDYLNEKVWYR